MKKLPSYKITLSLLLFLVGGFLLLWIFTSNGIWLKTNVINVDTSSQNPNLKEIEENLISPQKIGDFARKNPDGYVQEDGIIILLNE